MGLDRDLGSNDWLSAIVGVLLACVVIVLLTGCTSLTPSVASQSGATASEDHAEDSSEQSPLLPPRFSDSSQF